MIYLFDVDGTLTPSRKGIDKKFAVWFSKFCEREKVYIVTGSDKPKTIEQIGHVIYNRCRGVYQCSGSQYWIKEALMRSSNWVLPDIARQFLLQCLYEENFHIRTGLHIETRPGMVNYSVLGRNGTPEQRAKFIEYDKKTNSRKKTADAFNTLFPDLQATIGGETGLDIAPKGADKGQIIKDFAKTSEITFFGDAMFEGGNDYALKVALENGNFSKVKCIEVNTWQETWEHLKEEQSDKFNYSV